MESSVSDSTKICILYVCACAYVNVCMYVCVHVYMCMCVGMCLCVCACRGVAVYLWLVRQLPIKGKLKSTITSIASLI